MSATTTYREALWSVARRLGFDPSSDAGWTAEKLPVTELFNKAYRMAWETWPWRQVMTVREETPVAHGTVTGAMYVALENSTRTLDYVESVWSADPRVNASASEVPYRLEADGLYFYVGHPATVWVRYRDEVPEFTTTEWATSTAFVVGDLRLDGAAGADTGHVYVCAEAHTSGTWADDLAADKWTVVPVQTFLKHAVVDAVLACRREDDGETARSRSLMETVVRDGLEGEIKLQRQRMG